MAGAGDKYEVALSFFRAGLLNGAFMDCEADPQKCLDTLYELSTDHEVPMAKKLLGDNLANVLLVKLLALLILASKSEGLEKLFYYMVLHAQIEGTERHAKYSQDQGGEAKDSYFFISVAEIFRNSKTLFAVISEQRKKDAGTFVGETDYERAIKLLDGAEEAVRAKKMKILKAPL